MLFWCGVGGDEGPQCQWVRVPCGGERVPVAVGCARRARRSRVSAPRRGQRRRG
jgi:hypothetical protein